MLEVFQKLLQDQSKSWGQPQKEALVDLLLLGMYSDNLISLAENEFIETESDQMSWESGISFSGYLQRMIPRVRAAKDSLEQRGEFLLTIAERLGGAEACQRAFDELTALLAADGVVQLEEVFLEDVRKVLKL
jgi:hypothetical protein